MTASTAGWPFFIKIMALYAVLVCPPFAEMGNFPDLFHMAYCANTDPVSLMLDMVKFHAFFENQYVLSKRTR
jgi:hypothetical protein